MPIHVHGKPKVKEDYMQLLFDPLHNKNKTLSQRETFPQFT